VNLARRILRLAWPVFVSQLAVVLSGTIDTVVTGHASAADLAAMAVGSAIYSSIYVGLMGVVMALNPIVANRIGANDLPAAGRSFVDCVWMALMLSVIGGVAIGYPNLWVGLSHVTPEVGLKISGYLRGLVLALPAAILFRAIYAFNTGIGRPKLVMIINLIGLLIKLPLDIVLVYGRFGLPQMGAPGCALATAFVAWTSCMIGFGCLYFDHSYQRFEFTPRWPNWTRLRDLLRIGVPTGMSYIVEVTAFTSMAILAARLGAEVTSGHQIAANLAVLCYMVPLGLSIATATLAAQSLGAGDAALAERVLKVGLVLGVLFATALALSMFVLRHQLVGLYTNNPSAAAVAATLIGFVAVFHVFDASQSVSSFVLRAYGRTVAPMLIDLVALWGVGLFGGYALAFWPLAGREPEGITGLWLASTVSLGLVAVMFIGYAFLIARRVRLRPELIPALGADASS
jgi:MATE family multidrug resistance protein